MPQTTVTLMTEITEDLTEGKAIPCGLIGRFSMLKLSVLPILI